LPLPVTILWSPKELLFCPATIENFEALLFSPTTKDFYPAVLLWFFNFIPLSGSSVSSYTIGCFATTSFIASTKLDFSSVSKSSNSPARASNSLIASTIVPLFVVWRLVISPFFYPLLFLGYSAPIVASLLSACKSTSLIDSTTVFLLSVVNSGQALIPLLL
jgi:hypothetical protein